jgi:hypothetical protein
MKRDDCSPAARRDSRRHQRTRGAQRAGRVLGAGAALLFVLACAPTYHTAEVVRYDLATRAQLEARAQAECAARLAPLAGPPAPPSEPFRTDGCSWWPDAMFTGDGWQGCCIEHDLAYWCGGTAQMRRDADEALRQCVAKDYAGWVGAVMKPGVRLGGAPWVPAYFRWGYGHPYPAGYFEAAK